MVIAYVLVRVHAKQAIQLIEDLKKAPHVVEAAGVYGSTDVILKVETDDLRKLDKLVFQTIQSHKDVESTQTYVVIGDQYWKR